MSRPIRVELDLVQLFLLGMSFEICRSRHLWPSLPTLNGFLAVGVDDINNGPNIPVGTLTWQPIEVTASEYQKAMKLVDPLARIDTLSTKDGDWTGWFASAVARPEP